MSCVTSVHHPVTWFVFNSPPYQSSVKFPVLPFLPQHLASRCRFSVPETKNNDLTHLAPIKSIHPSRNRVLLIFMHSNTNRIFISSSHINPVRRISRLTAKASAITPPQWISPALKVLTITKTNDRVKCDGDPKRFQCRPITFLGQNLKFNYMKTWKRPSGEISVCSTAWSTVSANDSC